jgi:hypothetical protein
MDTRNSNRPIREGERKMNGSLVSDSREACLPGSANEAVIFAYNGENNMVTPRAQGEYSVKVLLGQTPIVLLKPAKNRARDEAPTVG